MGFDLFVCFEHWDWAEPASHNSSKNSSWILYNHQAATFSFVFSEAMLRGADVV